MTNNPEGSSQQFLATFVNKDGRFLWGTSDCRGSLLQKTETGDTKVSVVAEYSPFETPYIEVDFLEKATDEIKKVQIDTSEMFWVNKQRTGFETPMPVVNRLEVEVQDEWGIRKFEVPDSPSEPVTVRQWRRHEKPRTNDEDSMGEFGEPTRVDSDTELLIRHMVSSILSATVELAKTATQVGSTTTA